MRKQKPETFPRGEFSDRLDQLLSAASRAGISDLEIASTLSGRSQSYRERHVMSAPVESAGVLPKTTVYTDSGGLRERISAALKGEW
jgi:hypothetical protein